MIVVIADDFTGAAEVAGLAFNRGLRVILGSDVEVARHHQVQVFVLVSDTRSMERLEAEKCIRGLIREVQRFQPTLIFKKIDSVLRGHVYAELQVQMEEEKKTKVAILAGNPALGRLIIDGEFYIDGKKLSDTSFACDMEFPATTSNVLTLLGGECGLFHVSDALPEGGFVVGNVDSQCTLNTWARKFDSSWVLAGGAAFFGSVLSAIYPEAVVGKLSATIAQVGKRIIFLGSNYPKKAEFKEKLVALGLKYINLDGSFFLKEGSEGVKQQAKKIAKLSEIHDTVVISTIFKIDQREQLTPYQIRMKVGELAAAVFQQQQYDELFIEGGATANVIMQNLGVSYFEPTKEFAPGIIQMRDMKTNLHIVTKPGSYIWPQGVISEVDMIHNNSSNR